MGEKLNREVQRQLLQRLFDVYPQRMSANQLRDVASGSSFEVNLYYLAEHKLLKMEVYPTFDGDVLGDIAITARGLDFLADDGGLSAILGTVTVKLHHDTVRQLLIARVGESDEPQTTKQKVVDKLRSMPADELGRLTSKAVDAGLRNLPNAVQWLQAAIQSW